MTSKKAHLPPVTKGQASFQLQMLNVLTQLLVSQKQNTAILKHLAGIQIYDPEQISITRSKSVWHKRDPFTPESTSRQHRQKKFEDKNRFTITKEQFNIAKTQHLVQSHIKNEALQTKQIITELGHTIFQGFKAQNNMLQQILTKKQQSKQQLNALKKQEKKFSQQHDKSLLLYESQYDRFNPQSRDHRVIQKYQKHTLLKENNYQITDETKKQINSWMVIANEKITSDSFNKLNMNQLTNQETKNYVAKNILLNISEFFKQIDTTIKMKDGYQIMDLLNTQTLNISKKLLKKYPQLQIKGGNKKLKDSIERPDNLEIDHYNLVNKSQIQFKLKQSRNYSSEIMTFLNYVIVIASKDCGGQVQKSNFELFSLFLKNVCSYSGLSLFERQVSKISLDENSSIKEVVKNIQSHLNLDSIVKDTLYKQKNFNLNPDNSPTQNFYDTKLNIEEMISNFQKSHPISLKIGRKINDRVPLFTEQQIEAQKFSIKDSTILRIITKWCSELREKFKKAKQVLRQRHQPFVSFKGEQFLVDQKEKILLSEMANQHQKQIKIFLDNLKEQCSKMQFELIRQYYQSSQINERQFNLGILANRLQTCVGKYMFIYLNQLIHRLLVLTKDWSAIYKDIQWGKNYYQINLISFKIGDLMRARCAATQNHTIGIFQKLMNLSKNCPKILKMIRVKDRLQTSNNDLLINFQFLDIIQCQLQLSISSETSEKQKKMNDFNHLLYELSRSEFTTIAQCACIITQYDPIVKTYISSKLLHKSCLPYSKKQILSAQEKKLQLMPNQNKFRQIPFICYFCEKFIENVQPYFYKQRIHKKFVQQCNQCYAQTAIKQNNLSILHYLQGVSNQLRQLISDNFNIIDQEQYDRSEDKSIILQNSIIITKLTHQPIFFYLKTEKVFQSLYLVSYIKNTSQKQIIINLSETSSKKLYEDYWLAKLRNNAKIQIIKENEEYFIYDKIKQKKYELGSEKDRKLLVSLYENGKIVKNAIKKHHNILFLQNKNIDAKFNNLLKQSMPLIKKLHLAQNNIVCLKDFTKWFDKLRNLEELGVGNNHLKNLQGLQQCHKLTLISCYKNKMQSLKGIQNLKSMTTIWCDDNEIEFLYQLEGLENIKILWCNNNKLKSLKSLSNLHNLKQLMCKNQTLDPVQYTYLNNIFSNLQQTDVRKQQVFK